MVSMWRRRIWRRAGSASAHDAGSQREALSSGPMRWGNRPASLRSNSRAMASDVSDLVHEAMPRASVVLCHSAATHPWRMTSRLSGPPKLSQ